MGRVSVEVRKANALPDRWHTHFPNSGFAMRAGRLGPTRSVKKITAVSVRSPKACPQNRQLSGGRPKELLWRAQGFMMRSRFDCIVCSIVCLPVDDNALAVSVDLDVQHARLRSALQVPGAGDAAEIAAESAAGGEGEGSRV